MGLAIVVNGKRVEIPQEIESQGGEAVAAYLDKIAREQFSPRPKVAAEEK